MRCPKCQSKQIRVLDTRTGEDNTIVRRRKCKKCGHRFNTTEYLLPAEVIKAEVIKRNGATEKFSSRKLKQSIELASKDGLSPSELEDLLREVQGEVLRYSERGRLPSEKIGLTVLKVLFGRNRNVTALRFAASFFRERKPDIVIGISNVLKRKVEEKLEIRGEFEEEIEEATQG